MEDIQLLVDLHRSTERQGPGCESETLRAVDLARLDRGAALQIADIGCGTGSAALPLARVLNARVTAVDLMPEFIDQLRVNAEQQGLADRIEPLVASMDRLPFEQEAFDVIWSEGAIYSIGFERGTREWRRHLKPGGTLAVTEVTWLGGERPAELEDFWTAAYPEIDTASAKLRVLEANGYAPLGYFVLPGHCWIENYYDPLQARFGAFLERHAGSEAARAMIEAEEQEIEMYRKYRAHYGYGFYIASKCD